MRWDKFNALSLCAGCHFWWHQNPAEAVVWAMTKRPFSYLKELKQKNEPIKTWQLQEMLDKLTIDNSISV
jgi:hypothetical protein